VQRRTVEQAVDALAPCAAKQQVLDVPIPQVGEEIVDAAKVFPQERVRRPMMDRIAVPVPQTVVDAEVPRGKR